MRRSILFFTVTLLIFMLVSDISASNHADSHGFSARGMSRGNAMAASVNDWSSVWYNVAGLGKTRHLTVVTEEDPDNDMSLNKNGRSQIETDYRPGEIAINFMYTYPMFEINNAGGKPLDLNGMDVRGDNSLDYGMITFGTVIDLNIFHTIPEKFVSSARLGVSISVNTDSSLMKINDLDYRTHNFIRYGREAQRSIILAGIGLGFMRDLFGVGIGANMSFAGDGVVEINDVILTQDSQSPPTSANLELGIKPALTAGLYFNPGRLLPVLEGVSIGAAYRMESDVEIYPFKTNATMLIGETTLPLNLGIVDYYTPHIITAGLAYDEYFDLTVSLDIEYQLWSQFEIDPTIDPALLPELNNALALKLGLLWKPPVKWLNIMGGYSFQQSFIPDHSTTGANNFLDNDKHILSMGYIFLLPKLGETGAPIEITASYQLQILDERNINKLQPVLYNPNYSFGGVCHTFMISTSMKL